MEKNNLGDWVEAVLSRIGLGKTYWKSKRIARQEKEYEVDFNGHIFQDELGFSSDEGNDYTPSPDYLLGLCEGRIRSSDVIMDLGCGKGYAMYLMSKFPFKSIYGIDLSEKLVQIANDNMKKVDKLNRCKVWAIDATRLRENNEIWERLKECSYIYIYNSFPKAVMEKVVEELEEICISIERKLTIWYVSPSPECLEIIENSEKLSLVNRYFENESGGGVFEFVSK